jgi:hypothetical protein
MSASLFVRSPRPYGFSNPPEAVTRLLQGRHQLERFAMEQAGEVDYLITWRDELRTRSSTQSSTRESVTTNTPRTVTDVLVQNCHRCPQT